MCMDILVLRSFSSIINVRVWSNWIAICLSFNDEEIKIRDVEPTVGVTAVSRLTVVSSWRRISGPTGIGSGCVTNRGVTYSVISAMACMVVPARWWIHFADGPVGDNLGCNMRGTEFPKKWLWVATVQLLPSSLLPLFLAACPAITKRWPSTTGSWEMASINVQSLSNHYLAQ